MLPKFTESTALFSPCRLYRYELRRVWDASKPPIAFIGLNPSTADEFKLDPTVTRCVDYAQRWGGGSLVMLNLFGYRATDPRAMKAHPSPVEHAGGDDVNLMTIIKAARCAKYVIAAWGTHGRHLNQGERVKRVMAGVCQLHALKVTRDGHPAHPLYLRASLEPMPYV